MNKYENLVHAMLDGRQRFLKRKNAFKVEKRNKFGAKKCRIDSYTFDSITEGKEYNYWKTCQTLGEISDLEVHPSYEIILNNKLICKVELDFRFFDKKQNKVRIIDKKGMDNPMSKLKRKLVEAAHGIEVELT